MSTACDCVEQVFLIIQNIVLGEIVSCKVFLISQDNLTHSTLTLALIVSEKEGESFYLGESVMDQSTCAR